MSYRVFCLVFVILFPVSLQAKQILVTSGGQSFDQAILQAGNGDTLLLKAGIFYLSNYEINKSVTIIGEQGVVIDGGGESIFVLSAKNISISHCTFINVGVSYIKEQAAIRVFKAANCRILHNTFENCFFAIYIEKADSCQIIGNSIKGESDLEASSGNAIHLWYSNHAIVKNNYASGHRDGIYFEFVTETIIENNVSENNLRYGLHFMFSHNNEYRNNEFKNNAAGVAVMYSENVSMYYNRFFDNWGSNCYGLLLKDIKRSELKHNTFNGNTVAMHLDNALYLTIDSNEFSNNGWAFRIMSNSSDNSIVNNNFFNNTFEFTTTGKHNINTIHNNYWSSYSGYDINKDGVGDIPHKPVSLFSFIISKSQACIILLRSLFVDLLNFAEKVVPVFTPETMIDNAPLMKPV